MPLSDFKRIESGLYVLYTISYMTPRTFIKDPEAGEDTQLSKYDTKIYSTSDVVASIRIAWHNSEEGARAVKAILDMQVTPYEYKGFKNLLGHVVKIEKNFCIFEGASFHTLKGHVWHLADVEKCVASLENATDDKVMEMFGKYAREPGNAYVACFCAMTNLCCSDSFDPYMGTSRRVKN